MTPELLQLLTMHIERKTPCATVTNLSTGQQVLVHNGAHTGTLELEAPQKEAVLKRMRADKSGREGDLFVRVYAPPPRLIVIGAVHIAQFLIPMATLAGFDVILIDPREAFVRAAKGFGDVTTISEWPDEGLKTIDIDTRTAIVTLTHDPKLDDPALGAALKSSAFYIGALGSKRTHAKRLQRLAGDGFSDADCARINGPVGLAINAQSPAEIAVSIMAQIVEKLRAEG